MSTSRTRSAVTLVEMLVVIAIILALAALAAAFLPRVNESQNLTRAVDSLEQWLLTAKMRAKRDGLATGIRFMQAQGDPLGTVSTFQYVQQPETMSGGTLVSVQAGNPPVLTFAGVDFTIGVPDPKQWLVQPGDYLQIGDGGPYQIGKATGPTTLELTNSAYAQTLSLPRPTGFYRILPQPRILLGEEPLALPRNFAACFRQIPGSVATVSGTNVIQGPNGFWEVLFSPGGAVVGANAGASNGHVFISVWDTTMTEPDINRVGVVGVRVSTGFIGAYQASPGADPFYWAKMARESGM